MNNYSLSIDPSGTGTTCIFYPQEKKFEKITSMNWKEHLEKIREKIINNINDIVCESMILTVYFETVKSAYNNKNADLVPLIKLCGAVESLISSMPIIFIPITSDQTKRYARWFKDYIPENEKHYKRNIKKMEFIKNTEITFEKNKYYFQGKKISTHERDAILIYFIGEVNNDSRNNY